MQLSKNFLVLTEILKSIGERIEGNLICDVFADNYVMERNLPKIENLQYLAKNKKRICEIGINACHSLLLMLEQNESADYLLFDLNNHRYTEPSLSYIKSLYKQTSIESVFGDSKITISNFLESNPQYKNTFDLIHIDGGHDDAEVNSDYESAKKLAAPNALIIFDDYDYQNIKTFIDSKLEIGEIEKVIDSSMVETNLHFVYKLKK